MYCLFRNAFCRASCVIFDEITKNNSRRIDLKAIIRPHWEIYYFSVLTALQNKYLGYAYKIARKINVTVLHQGKP